MARTKPAAIKGDPPIFAVFTEIDIIAHLAATAFEAVLPDGLTNAQFGVLNHLLRLDTEETVGELADAFQVRQPTMSSTVRKLEDKGLVELRPEPGDRRVRRVAVTRAGELTRQAGLYAVEPLYSELAPAVTQKELKAILPTLSKLRTALDERRAG